MLRSFLPLVGVCSWVAGISLAQAATVSRQSGEVLANSGAGFVAVSTTAELAPGAQILVRPGGSALIQYANGCSVKVGDERIWVIPDKPPCAEGRAVDMTGRMSDGGSMKDTPEPEDKRRWIIPGLLIAGGAATAIVLISKDDDPTSP